MKKILSLLLASSLLLVLLTGCSKSEPNPEAEHFYTTVDEILALEDVRIEAVLPFHGAFLEVEGFISGSEQKADLTVSITGTEKNDGTLTRLLVDGKYIWLDVRTLAEATLEFDLFDYYRQDINDLYEAQFAEWVVYVADEHIWSGIPGWGELLYQIWTDSREDLEQHITASETGPMLKLSDSDSKLLRQKTVDRILAEEEAFRSGFLTFARQENDLMLATRYIPEDLFDSWVDTLKTQQVEPDGLTIILTENEDGYELRGESDGGESWQVCLTEAESDKIERPVSVMEFGAYGDAAYYLLTFSLQYMGAVLDGAEVDENLQMAYESEMAEEYIRQDMTTQPVSGYSAVSTVTFVPEGGHEMNIPILNHFLGNTVTPAGEDISALLDVYLEGDGWRLSVISELSDVANASTYLEQKVQETYDPYIYLSGYLLTQDLSPLAHSADGSAHAQGFAYRVDEYSDPEGIIFVVLEQQGSPSYVLIEISADLASLTDADREAFRQFFEVLNLEAPIQLAA